MRSQSVILDGQEGNARLRSQFATSSSGYGGRRYAPYAFTEHGAIIQAIRQLMAPPPKPARKPIGFQSEMEP